MSNAKYVKEKKIIVKSVGTINILGGVTGPILKPFIRDTKTIMHLVNTNCEVYEILNDGSQLKLTMRNYETDNNVTVPPVVEAEQESQGTEDAAKNVEAETATDIKPVENKAYEKNNKKNK